MTANEIIKGTDEELDQFVYEGIVDLILRILTITITSVFILFFGLGGISFAILFYLVLNLLKISILKIGNDSNIN